MKENWEYKNIEECLEKVAVPSKLQTKDFLPAGEFPVVSQEEDYISGYWNGEADVVRLSHPIVVFGDHSRVVKYIDFDFVVGADGVKILSPKDYLDPKFLYYFVRYTDVPSLGYSRHYKLLREKDVPIPPLTEQSQIVAELDLLSGVIDKQKAQLKELDNLAQSTFYDMFGDPIENPKGWDVNVFGNVCDIICGQDYKSVQNENGEYPVYGSGGIMTRANSYRCPENSVILGRKGNINNPIFVREKFWNVDTAFGIVARPTLNPLYLFFFCKNYDFNRHNVAVTIPSLRRIDILQIGIPVPPLSLQQEFAAKITSIEKQKAALTQSIAETQKLLDYTMDKYFG